MSGNPFPTANGPWKGPGEVEAVHTEEGLGIVQIHLPGAPALFTRLQVEVAESPQP